MTKHRAAKARKALENVPADPFGAFAWFVSQCAQGFHRELTERGCCTSTDAHNAIAHCFLDFAAGVACRVASGEDREPDIAIWRKAADEAFERATKRT